MCRSQGLVVCNKMCFLLSEQPAKWKLLCLSMDARRHFEGTEMRGRAQVVAAHLTPGQVLVTWPREKAEVDAAFQEELWDLCGQELGGDIFFL